MKQMLTLLGGVAALASAVLALAGCDRGQPPSIAPKTTDLGTGLNSVEKTYARPADEMVDAARRSLQGLQLAIDADTHDKMGGEISAHRADGRKVTAKVTAVDSSTSRVSVRVAPGDRNLAELIHERIGRETAESPKIPLDAH